ncbi:protein of unknown function (plasmid) [Pararobbsia alpina]|uniref:hypothetical protein n=1 Tax=Pararobbsia alpina TaxID=621374 RepID=UPI0039A4B3E6
MRNLGRDCPPIASTGGDRGQKRFGSAADLCGKSSPQGRSLKLIQALIGVSSLSAVKTLVKADPVRLAAIVSGVICACGVLKSQPF